MLHRPIGITAVLAFFKVEKEIPTTELIFSISQAPKNRIELIFFNFIRIHISAFTFARTQNWKSTLLLATIHRHSIASHFIRPHAGEDRCYSRLLDKLHVLQGSALWKQRHSHEELQWYVRSEQANQKGGSGERPSRIASAFAFQIWNWRVSSLPFHPYCFRLFFATSWACLSLRWNVFWI